MRLLALVLLTALLVAVCSAAWTAGSPAKAVITFEQPVYANMPVWVHVALPDTPELEQVRVNLRYPLSPDPWDFRGHAFQVTRDGVSLPMRIDPRRTPSLSGGGAGGGGSIAPPTSPAGRLPLHLLYRFDRPGKYLV